MITISILPIKAQDSIDLELSSSEIMDNYDVIPDLFYTTFKYDEEAKRFDSVYIFGIESNHLEGDVIIVENTIDGLLIVNDLILSLIHEEPDCGDELNVNLFIQEYDTFEAAYEVALIMRESDELCYDPNL